ncbi:hypothetical protein O3P69_003850 [Scylla paramamosain]|uniref:Uncharacterized protein n=1 Tax=Scylla paramamosain TaxID=85552 RepID=A0AAW0UFY9_SCYPA
MTLHVSSVWPHLPASPAACPPAPGLVVVRGGDGDGWAVVRRPGSRSQDLDTNSSVVCPMRTEPFTYSASTIRECNIEAKRPASRRIAHLNSALALLLNTSFRYREARDVCSPIPCARYQKKVNISWQGKKNCALAIPRL